MNASNLTKLFAAVAVASLGACGGGESSTPAPAPAATTPAPAPATTTPAPAPATSTPAPAPATSTPAPAPATSTPAPAPAPASGTVPSPTGTPTATLAASQTEATNLATEAKAGLVAAAGASAGAGVKTPFGVEASALPTGVTQTVLCSTFGGTGSITYDVPTTAMASGYTLSLTYNSCAYLGYAFNGTIKLIIDRYVSPTDFAYSATYNNFTVSGNGVTNQSVSGSQTCNFSAGVSSCTYSDGSRNWSGITYSGGMANGSYAVNYGSGSIKVTYSNFGATGGTATITGASGSKAVITRNSATSFTVVITPAGSTSSSSYTVTI